MYNHVKTVFWRVHALDLAIFRTYFFVMDSGVPPCDQPPSDPGELSFVAMVTASPYIAEYDGADYMEL